MIRKHVNAALASLSREIMVAASPLMLTQTCVVDSVKPTEAYTQMTICTEVRPDRACHISGHISRLHAKDMCTCTNVYSPFS